MPHARLVGPVATRKYPALVSDGFSDEQRLALEARLRHRHERGEVTYVDATPQEIRATYPTTTDGGLRRWVRVRITREGDFDIID
jgi:hypothetical protein